eukprot:30809-Pelagococcus_subviridis.AAC.3
MSFTSFSPSSSSSSPPPSSVVVAVPSRGNVTPPPPPPPAVVAVRLPVPPRSLNRGGGIAFARARARPRASPSPSPSPSDASSSSLVGSSMPNAVAAWSTDARTARRWRPSARAESHSLYTSARSVVSAPFASRRIPLTAASMTTTRARSSERMCAPPDRKKVHRTNRRARDRFVRGARAPRRPGAPRVVAGGLPRRRERVR